MPAAVVTVLRGAPGSRPAKPISSALTVSGELPSSCGSVAVPAMVAVSGSGTPSPSSSTTEACIAVTVTAPVPPSKPALSGAGSMPLRVALSRPMKASALITARAGTPPPRSG